MKIHVNMNGLSGNMKLESTTKINIPITNHAYGDWKWIIKKIVCTTTENQHEYKSIYSYQWYKNTMEEKKKKE